MMGSYAYRKVDIEGVGCFTVPKPVWDLLQDIDTIRDETATDLVTVRAKWQAATDSLEVITNDAVRFLARAEAAIAERDTLRGIAREALAYSSPLSYDMGTEDYEQVYRKALEAIVTPQDK